jgi:hypothetical protein
VRADDVIHAGAMDLVTRTGRKYWVGREAPVPGCVTSDALLEARGLHRASPDEHGTYDVVYLVETDLGTLPYWQVLVDEALRLLGASGTLVVRYTPSTLLGPQDLMALVSSRIACVAGVAFAHTWPGERTRVVGIDIVQTKPPVALGGVTFGLVTDGRAPDRVTAFVDSVVAIRGLARTSSEILVCGPAGCVDHLAETFGVDVRLVVEPAENANLGWITRKKNLLVDAAHCEIVVVAHDRYTFTPGWLESLRQFGTDFDVVVPRQTTVTGMRFPDWVGVADDRSCSPIFELDYADFDPRAYVNGGIIVARTSLLKEVRWNELLFWGDAEDIELSRRLQARGVVPRLAIEMVVETVVTRADQLAAFERYVDHPPRSHGDSASRSARLVSKMSLRTFDGTASSRSTRAAAARRRGDWVGYLIADCLSSPSAWARSSYAVGHCR